MKRVFFAICLAPIVFGVLSLIADCFFLARHPAHLFASSAHDRQRIEQTPRSSAGIALLTLMLLVFTAAIFAPLSHARREGLFAARVRTPEPGSLAWLRAHKWHPYRVLATAYFIGPYQDRSYPCPLYDGRTADGARVRYGSVAVDRHIIPYRRELYVPRYGFAVADDSGGFIRGAHIDLARRTCARARAWGARSITIWVAPTS